MKQFKKPIIKATGSIHIGETFMMSLQASWPFGKIEIYQDHIFLRVQYIPNLILYLFQLLIGENISKGIRLSYSDISGYKEKNAWIMGYGITIIHVDNQHTPFLQIWISKNKAKKIISYLNSKNIYKKD